ncbi:MAG: trypsin-like peptidase domain-containing protein [Chloroflexota bacterium]|nr:trypsin-like peptidase domain-containing protein [Chloroflexota bacterium]
MKQRRWRHWFVSLGLIVALAVSCVGGSTIGWAASSTGALPRWPMAAEPTATTVAPGEPVTSDLEAQIAATYRRVGPSVVNITSRRLNRDFFLNPLPRDGTGSGFFYDRAGHIVTNYHVVEDAEEVHVALADGRDLPAEVVGSDPSNDLAVLKVDLAPEEVPVATLGDSTALYVGQFVVAIGNPFGLERTLTVGVVSSLGRVIDSPNERFIGEVIQTDAPINPGNSGGPLLNLQGEVIGVNSAILSPSGASAGIGFAVPARTVKRVVPALIKDGRYPHPALGVTPLALTPQRIEVLKAAGMEVPVERGVLIVEVVPGGPAARAGLRGTQREVRHENLVVPVGGDIITAIDDHPIETERDLIVYLETRTEVGQMVKVTIIRDGQEQTLPITLGELPQRDSQ